MMSSAAVAPTTVSRPAINPWIVAVAVVVPTFMEVLDTTIANVALRYIAGGLRAANIDSEWVLTSYLAANATILPISGWLSAHLGASRSLLIAVFTIASGLCGMATTLPQLILFRVIQGLAGGGLQPSSQSVLLDSFPPEKQGARPESSVLPSPPRRQSIQGLTVLGERAGSLYQQILKRDRLASYLVVSVNLSTEEMGMITGGRKAAELHRLSV